MYAPADRSGLLHAQFVVCDFVRVAARPDRSRRCRDCCATTCSGSSDPQRLILGERVIDHALHVPAVVRPPAQQRRLLARRASCSGDRRVVLAPAAEEQRERALVRDDGAAEVAVEVLRALGRPRSTKGFLPLITLSRTRDDRPPRIGADAGLRDDLDPVVFGRVVLGGERVADDADRLDERLGRQRAAEKLSILIRRCRRPCPPAAGPARRIVRERLDLFLRQRVVREPPWDRRPPPARRARPSRFLRPLSRRGRRRACCRRHAVAPPLTHRARSPRIPP